jgi:hypothetical protein
MEIKADVPRIADLTTTGRDCGAPWQSNTGAAPRGGHGAGDHEHEDGEAHEHATGPGLCGTRCPSHFTQNVSIGWNAATSANRPRLSFQVNIENLSNKVYLLSTESTMVQGQYSIPRLISGSLKVGF